ncbi:MAG: molybdate ABC transporter substrate-binding protein [Thermoanaerobaculia bacterium]
MRRTLCLLVAIFLSVSGAARAAELLVCAAASLTDVFAVLGAEFERAGGDKPTFNFAASSVLARQIEAGGPCDVFVSADEEKMDELERRKLVVPGTRRDLLGNELVVVVATASTLALRSATDLATPAVRLVALADPQSVPAGIYAKQWLMTAGLWSKVIDRVVPTENVRAALAAVEAGNADAGIVYRTDALGTKRVRIAYAVPAGESPKIVYPAAVLSTGKNAAGAKRFLELLVSPTGRQAFERFGFRALF